MTIHRQGMYYYSFNNEDSLQQTCVTLGNTDQYVMDGCSFSVLVGMTGSLRSSALVVDSLHMTQTPSSSHNLLLSISSWFSQYSHHNIITFTSKNSSHLNTTYQFPKSLTTLDTASTVSPELYFQDLLQ